MLRLVHDERKRSGGESSPGGPVTFRIAREFEDPFLELIRLLHEACEIEHSLMIQYLYAAFSVRPQYADLVGDPGSPRSDCLLGVAIQEMQHLDQVNRLLVGLGAPPNLTRQDFPYEPEIYPFEMRLERLSRESLAKYIYAEAPSEALSNPEGLDPDDRRFAEDVLALLPQGARLNHIGTLYRTIIALLDELPAMPAPSLSAASIRSVLQHILEEGVAHFAFFKQLFLGTVGSLRDEPNPWADPKADSFPSLAVPTNPTTLADPGGLQNPALRTKARAGNAHYWIVLGLLRCRYLALGASPPNEAASSSYANGARNHMLTVLGPVARELATAGEGMPFDCPSIANSGWIDDAKGHRYLLGLVDEARTLARIVGAHDPEFQERCEGPLAETERLLRDMDETADAVVVGAGPAGLAAAVALTSRGLRVKVLERAHLIGGKVHSYRQDGRSFEHGVHGWWHNYLNFEQILRQASVDVSRALKEADGSNVALQDGTIQRLGTLPWPVPSPFFLLIQILRNPMFSLRDAFGALRFGIHALAFDHERDYPSYDHFSFQQFMDQVRLPHAIRDLFLTPFILSFDFASPDRVSAACGLSGLQFYILPNQESVLTRWSRGIPAEQVFNPLADLIIRRGGSIDLNSAVARLVIRNGAVVGVEHADPTGANSAEVESVIGRLARADVPAHGFRSIGTLAGPVWVGLTATGNILALRAACTHQGCPVDWHSSTDTFVCPCHGGVYNPEGQPVSGPPPRPLETLATRQAGDQVEILGRPRQKTIGADAVVLATDLHAAQAILAGSEGAPPHLVRDLHALDTTPVIVVRMWFAEGAIVPKGLESAITPKARFIDNFFHLNAFDSVYDQEGTLIEVQSYRVAEWLDQPDADILAVVFQDLAPFCPQAQQSQLKKFNINRHRALFTLYAPGKAALRPHTDSGIAGLYLAGDWTDAAWSVWMMERAVVSGLTAANRILVMKGKEPVEILRLRREGIFLRASRAVSRLLRRLGVAPLDTPVP